MGDEAGHERRSYAERLAGLRRPADIRLMDGSRRGFLCLCGCTALAIGAAGAAALLQATHAEAAAGGEVLRVGHLPAGCVSHLLLAKKRGMFRDAGLTVELTQFNAPSDNLQALVAGALDVSHNPWTTTMAAFGDGNNDLRIIGGSGASGIELVARKGSVKTVAEFAAAAGKGLRVGTLKLDTLELVGYGTMVQHGRSYKDYEMTFFPSMVGMGDALINGAVDVCTLAQPYAQSVVQQSGGVYLASSNDVWGPRAADCVINALTPTVSAKADTLKAYMKVLQAAAKQFSDNYEAALDDLQPIYGAPRDVLAIALKRQYPDPVIDATGVAGIRKGNGYLIELGYFPTNFADRVLDLSHQPTAV